VGDDNTLNDILSSVGWHNIGLFLPTHLAAKMIENLRYPALTMAGNCWPGEAVRALPG
jgi:hypothetical protein